jgi:hypothetical protein
LSGSVVQQNSGRVHGRRNNKIIKIVAQKEGRERRRRGKRGRRRRRGRRGGRGGRRGRRRSGNQVIVDLEELGQTRLLHVRMMVGRLAIMRMENQEILEILLIVLLRLGLMLRMKFSSSSVAKGNALARATNRGRKNDLIKAI